ncbi:MAG: hypothetical protein ACTSRS_22515 [Candidatus Helarchaeota archaeon]
MKEAKFSMWKDKLWFKVQYCPKCKLVPEYNAEQVSVFKGKALRGIDKRNGRFRMKVMEPEDYKKDIIVETYPDLIVTTPSEWKYSRGKGVYKTKGRVSKLYPEVTRGDEVIVAGIQIELNPLYPLLLHNSTVGISYQFVKDNVSTKTGFFSTLILANPFLEIAREKITRYIE